MTKEIIINSSTTQTRVAITEEGNLVDFFVDYPENRRMVGDMYLGRIARVLPGIRAAFVDIGMKHDAFLHFSDIGETTKQLQDMIGEDDSDVDDDDDDESPQQQRNNPRITGTVNIVYLIFIRVRTLLFRLQKSLLIIKAYG